MPATVQPAERHEHTNKNPELVKLELALAPNKVKDIDFYTRLEAIQIFIITLWRSLSLLARTSLEKIKELSDKNVLSPEEKAFLEKRRAVLTSKGVNVEEPFAGVTALCNNFEVLQVSYKGGGRGELYKTLEPKAPVTTNSFSMNPDGEPKKRKWFGLGGE